MAKFPRRSVLKTLAALPLGILLPARLWAREQTFSSFIVNRKNEFAHAACQAFAASPGRDEFNPLFLCGPAGVGKTHLVRAIEGQMREQDPLLNVRYVTARRFPNDWQRYNGNCDLVIIEDIQELGKEERVQEGFLQFLEGLLRTKTRVVVTSDRFPRRIEKLDARIASRLEWGLIADVNG